MGWCARTYDEIDICVGDIVKVTVHLTRVEETWQLEVDSFRDVQQIDPPEKTLPVMDARMEQKLMDDINSGIYDASIADQKDYAYGDGLTFVENELDEAKRLQIARMDAPVVHVNRFPFCVKEKWMVLLIDHSTPAVIDQHAIPALVDTRKIDLHFRINRPPGKYQYSLWACCDSYLGCDKHAEFSLNVKPPEMVETVASAHDNKAGFDCGNHDTTENDKYRCGEPKWYYLWNSTFWEFLLTLFLLYFMYLVLDSSSFGKKWINPYMEKFFNVFVYPITNEVFTKLQDVVIEPLVDAFVQATGFDIEMLSKQ